MIFTKKIHYRPFESFKKSSYHSIRLKKCQHTQFELDFHNCLRHMKIKKVHAKKININYF
jgi:hypothetical protein